MFTIFITSKKNNNLKNNKNKKTITAATVMALIKGKKIRKLLNPTTNVSKN